VLYQLITGNPIASSEFQPSSREVALIFQKKLIAGGIRTMLRVSRGTDIAAGCGQLRSVGWVSGVGIFKLKKRIVVIGAGAAGMMAAGRALNWAPKFCCWKKQNVRARKFSSAAMAVVYLSNTCDLETFILQYGP